MPICIFFHPHKNTQNNKGCAEGGEGDYGTDKVKIRTHAPGISRDKAIDDKFVYYLSGYNKYYIFCSLKQWLKSLGIN